MKKLLLTTALVAAATVITPATASEGLGFNAALYGGYVGSSSTVDRKTVGGIHSTKTDLGGNGGTVGLMFAYDRVMGNGFVWGLDVFGAWHNHDATSHHKSMAEDAKFEAEMKYSFGTAAKFGYMFSKSTLGFFRIGYINSRFDLKSTNGMTTTSAKKHKNASGLLLGLGVDLPLNQKMALGFSYDFGFYKKQKMSHTATADYDFKPRMHFVNIALKYKF